jgi:predicted regulator of Ras-like GTPase activity (Roadblock/LC7/MglB family)
MASLPVLIEEDISELDRALHDLLMKAEADNALLIDKGGFLITHCGDRKSCDTTTLAALAAASYAATEGIASLVNEPNFTSVYQQGGTFSLLVENVDENCLLTVVFRAQISVGAVKYFATSTIKQIAKQLKKARKRSPDGGLDLSMLNVADTRPLFAKKAG